MARLTKAHLSLLGTIVAAMAVEATPYAMVTPAEAKPLLDAKLVEQNADIKDGDKVATRATEAGIAKNAESSAPKPPSAALPTIAVTRAGSEGAATLDLDAFAKKSRSQSSYDFDSMNKGDYFFVEATEARPNPAKSLASTVSAANKKFGGDETPEDQRRTYVVAPFAKDEEKGGYKAATAGALVVRTK